MSARSVVQPEPFDWPGMIASKSVNDLACDFISKNVMPKTAATKRAPLGELAPGQLGRRSKTEAKIRKKKSSRKATSAPVIVRRATGRVIGLGGSRHAKHMPVKK